MGLFSFLKEDNKNDYESETDNNITGAITIKYGIDPNYIGEGTLHSSKNGLCMYINGK